MHFYGYGVEKNYTKAKENYEIAAKKKLPEAFCSLGKLYYYGYGVDKDYKKSKEYLEMAAEYDVSEALNQLGQFYRHGVGVTKDISKALLYYKRAAKKNHSEALFNLGFVYFEGIVCVKDILKAIHYFKLSSEQGNSNALINLGVISSTENKTIKKDYSKAIEYFELAANENNGLGFWHLGGMYENGEGVEKDYLKAKEYYEKSSRFNNSLAFLSLGHLYYNGYGVKKDYKEAIKNYKYAYEMGDLDALYYLGSIYSNTDDFDYDIEKSIAFFKKNIELTEQEYSKYNPIENVTYNSYVPKKYYLPSYNDLGLIYITVFDDKKNGFDCIKIAADGEYPFAECNLGLLYQFCLDKVNIEEAKYRYEKASKYKFAMAEFNLGKIYEDEGEQEKSIEYFKMASDHEDEPLFFHGNVYNDKRLEISKVFILCLTNLKLTHYFFLHNNYKEAKKYFIRSFNKLILVDNDSTYQFKFVVDENFIANQNLFAYLGKYILNFPLFFNLNNQNKEFQSKQISNTNSSEKLCSKPINEKYKEINSKVYMEKNIESEDLGSRNCKNISNFYHNSDVEIGLNIYENDNKIIFNNPSILFDYAMKNAQLQKCFIDEIQSIIDSLLEILYIKPYNILFGRINICKQKEIFEDIKENIDDTFYEGFSND